jgi:hypothetical protein
MMTKEVEAIDPALVARMVTLVQNLAEHTVYQDVTVKRTEAREIVALLPKPVDPDLLEARQIAHDFAGNGATWAGILEGKHDTSPAVECVLKSIKRGRELAQASA